MPAPTAVFRYLLLVLPAIFLATSGARLYGFFHERSDIWWTPSGDLGAIGGESRPGNHLCAQ